MQIKKGDKVKIITGSNKGQEGVVMTLLREENRVVIDGINVSPKKKKDPRTGKVNIMMMARPIDASNVKKV